MTSGLRIDAPAWASPRTLDLGVQCPLHALLGGLTGVSHLTWPEQNSCPQPPAQPPWVPRLGRWHCLHLGLGPQTSASPSSLFPSFPMSTRVHSGSARATALTSRTCPASIHISLHPLIPQSERPPFSPGRLQAASRLNPAPAPRPSRSPSSARPAKVALYHRQSARITALPAILQSKAENPRSLPALRHPPISPLRPHCHTLSTVLGP